MPRRRARALFFPVPPQREVDEEIAAHLELQTRRYEAQGLSLEAARAKALGRFGDVARVRDECREIRQEMEADMRAAELLQEIRHDLAVALRAFAKQPLFTAAALLTLAVGVGANTAVFSVVNAVLLRALPYRHADRVVTVWNSYAATGLARASVAPAEVADLREQQRAFDAVAAATSQPSNLDGDASAEPERVTAYVVSPNLFDLLGTAPALGRPFAAADGQEGSPRVVLLSHALWRRRFGSDPHVVGRTMSLAGLPRTIVGVLPPAVRFPDAPLGGLRERGDVYIPYDYERARTEDRGNQRLAVFARLKPGATAADAQRDLDAIAARFRLAFPDRYDAAHAPGWRLAAEPIRDVMLGGARPALVVVAVAVGLVLLIACVNVANLLLARGAARGKEIAVRVALGARRGRLVRQLLTESAALALAGGALGVLLAWAGVRALLRLDPGGIPRLDATRVDGAALLFSLGASVLTGALFGLFPALRHSRADVRAALGETSRGTTSSRAQGRLRAGLVAAEVAMACVVLVAAALLGRSFAALERVRPGFAPASVLTMQTSLPARTYDSTYKVAAFYERLAAQLATVPGARAASVVYPLPMGGDGWGASFVLEGAPAGAPEPHAEYAVALPGYFRAMGVPLRAGRDFTADDKRGAPEVVIVDEILARRFWPGERALGKRVNLIGRPEGVYATVVGVVGHVRNGGPQEEGEPQIYMPLLQRPLTTTSIVVRRACPAACDPTALAASVRERVRAIDPALPVARVATMDDVVAGAVTRERFSALLLGVFATAALLLAAVGLYGVMAYLVAQRTAEVGIRIALGGRPADVRRLVVRQGVGIAAAGLGAGLLGALALSRSLARLLYEVRPTDPVTYVGIALLLLFVSVLASYVPARRATRIDPVNALRG
jgi:predicted permease